MGSYFGCCCGHSHEAAHESWGLHGAWSDSECRLTRRSSGPATHCARCRGSLSPCDSMSRTCRAAYPACAQPLSALIIAPEVALPCALYAAPCGKTVRGLLQHCDDDPVHLRRSHAMVVAQGRASLRTMSSRMCRGQI